MMEYLRLEGGCQIMGISISSSIDEVTLDLVDTPPGCPCTKMIKCVDVLFIQLSREPGDDLAYAIVDMYWETVRGLERRSVWTQLDYTFNPVTMANFMEDDEPIVHLYFEGDLCGDIVCKRLEFQ